MKLILKINEINIKINIEKNNREVGGGLFAVII